ncbi:MAG: biotin--[acetyl-CoA-carboxylase] ligase [Oscillospiraceae bacterium]|nr:biotin--[acetyl-CoA-carboxylase] ligase [Oscillospiraceae bacterium]
MIDMNRSEILKYLSESCPWQDSVLYFDSIDSTNTRAKLLAAQGAPHGTVLIADHQTGGRGRLGRRFSSPGGMGVYLSVILRPNCAPAELMHLTCAAAVAMCSAVEQAAGFRPGIKWTNDLVCQSRKLAGILTELSLRPSGIVDYAVVGIGINCCQRPSDFPEEIQGMAGSLSMISEKQIDRSRVAAAMIDALHRMDSGLLTDKKATMDRYRADCITLGKDISLVKADGSVRHGHAMDIDDEGALIVQFADGTLETVNSGEVSVRGMYGYA